MGETIQAEYIWVDGGKPLNEAKTERNYKRLRSKTKILHDMTPEPLYPENFPKYIESWGFDGSSTHQADTGESDVKLVPVRVVPDPIRGVPNLLVLCETYSFNKDGADKPHVSNTRHRLAQLMKRFGSLDPWVGIE